MERSCQRLYALAKLSKEQKLFDALTLSPCKFFCNVFDNGSGFQETNQTEPRQYKCKTSHQV